jgi:hypothetical protein
MRDLSILIPARNEEWLAKTISSIIENAELDTEVIAVLDGAWANPPIVDHPNVQLIYHNKSLGQRATTNEAARVSTAKYVMKMDAHCAVDKGFDRKMIEPYESGELDRKDMSVPRMYNLHVFDWECKQCKHTTYQGPKPSQCEKCKAPAEEIERITVWMPRLNRVSDWMRFDHTLHFQYWSAYRKRPGVTEEELSEQFCCVGACWMMTRERYWEIGGCDEQHGSWGQQGVEMSCKSWLSGGRQIVNKRTWFSHLFRTQPGFGFPYPMSNGGVERARERSRWLWLGNNWEGQVRPLSWLIDHFRPIPDWHDPVGAPQLKQVLEAGEEYYTKKGQPVPAPEPVRVEVISNSDTGVKANPKKGIVYYTENQLDPFIMRTCQKQLVKAAKNIDIVSVSLRPVVFGNRNIVLELARGYETMFRQILTGLEVSDADVIYLCEHDLLYSESHFEFTPPKSNIFYYNQNTWKVDSKSGQALFYYCNQTSGLCAYRSLLVDHYRKRLKAVLDAGGYNRNMGFEPGTNRWSQSVDEHGAASWMSPVPNIDIRHNSNLTRSRWSQDQFRDKRTCTGWKMADQVPHWGVTKGRFAEFLAELDA